MAKKTLELPCDTIPEDTLQATSYGHYVHLLITAAENDGIELKEAGARELFNWLGVWLHTR